MNVSVRVHRRARVCLYERVCVSPQFFLHFSSSMCGVCVHVTRATLSACVLSLFSLSSFGPRTRGRVRFGYNGKLEFLKGSRIFLLSSAARHVDRCIHVCVCVRDTDYTYENDSFVFLLPSLRVLYCAFLY